MTADKYTTGFIYKTQQHHLLGTHLYKLLTKCWQREKAENWITVSSSFPNFSFFFCASKLASHETAGLHLESSERWVNPTMEPQEGKGSASLRRGGNPILERREIEP